MRIDYGQVRQTAEMDALSADMRSYVVGKTSIGIWRRLSTAVPSDPEKELFTGLVPVLLAIVALGAAARGYVNDSRWNGVYAAIGAACVLLSLGPVVRVWGHVVTEHGPYEWLVRVVPGWSGMRVPARFAIVVMLALSVLAAFGARVVFERLRPRVRWAAVALCCALLAESWSAPIVVNAYSPRGRPVDRAVADWLRPSAPGAVLELPILTTDFQELDYQYATLLHGHPIGNGYSGYETPLQRFWREPGNPLQDFDRFPAVVRMLRSIGIRYVIVNPEDYDGTRKNRREPDRTIEGLRASGQIVREQRLLDAVGFELQPAEQTAPMSADSIALQPGEFTVSVAAGEDRAANLTDGDPDTRWSGAQDGGSWIAAAMPHPVDVARVELVMEDRSRMDYPLRTAHRVD